MKKLYTLILLFAILLTAKAQSPALIDIYPGSGGSHPANFASVNNTMFIQTNFNGSQLWKTDGTQGGTALVKNLDFYSGYYTEGGYGEVNNKLVFTAWQGSGYNVEPWVTDGTTNGTIQLKDINPVSSTGSECGGYTLFNNKVYFTALDTSFSVNFDQGDVYGIWATDGTPAGTQEISSILIFPHYYGWRPEGYTPFNNKLYFFASDSFEVEDIWVTDGTTIGTHKLLSNPGGGHYSSFVVMNSNLYLMTNDSSNRIWQVDVNTPSLTLVKDIGSSFGANIYSSKVINNSFYFTGPDGNNQDALWISDGTTGGTHMVYDINTSGGSDIYAFVQYHNKLFFFADDGTGEALWTSDGTSGGTAKVKQFPLTHYPGNELMVYNDRMYLYTYNNADTLNTFWQSDGTTQGTTSFATEIGISYWSGNYRSMNGSLYFDAYLDNHGDELWKLTTTPAGIRLTEADANIALYPNPATDQLFIQSTGPEIEQINIYNTTGSLVIAALGSSMANGQLSVVTLPQGVYIAEIKTKDAVVKKRWVKM